MATKRKKDRIAARRVLRLRALLRRRFHMGEEVADQSASMSSILSFVGTFRSVRWRSAATGGRYRDSRQSCSGWPPSGCKAGR